MAPAVYDWTRFWCPRGMTIHTTEHGYLLDPAGELGRYANKNTVRLADLSATPCIVLLGEAGIGKSTELRTIQACAQIDSLDLVTLDLGQYSSADDLRHDLFENEQIQAWKAGTSTLCLLLDALDEALLESPRIIGLVQRVLHHLPIDRLRLRLACRTAAWPETLTDSLVKAFGEDHVGLYELTPLRRADIESAVRVEALDEREFIAQVEQRGAGTLAANPTTLKLLMGIFRAQEQLPPSRVGLYERGLTALCTPSQERRERNRPAAYTPSQLMQIAARIAAAVLLTRRTSVFTGCDHDAADTDVVESELAGGKEELDGVEFEVTPEAVRLALAETGLFSSRGANRLGFAHKTYGEFLAARYLHGLKPPETQLRHLLYAPDEHPPRLVPQLHEVSAWLASMDAGLFGRIMEIEPEVLLLSDVMGRDAAAQERLVEALLRRVDKQELPWKQLHGLRSYLHRLAHGALAAQLHAVMNDAHRSVETRKLAIQIADVANQVALADEIADIALDVSLDYDLRDTAAHAVVNLNEPSASKKLRPLALGQASDDPDDQLRGCGLMATWPEHLSLDELLQALTPAKRPNFGGAYSQFVWSGMIEARIDAGDLPAALEWGCRFAGHDHETDSLGRTAARLATQALQRLEQPAVLDALVKFVLTGLKGHARWIFASAKEGNLFDLRTEEKEDEVAKLDEARRRILVQALVSRSVSVDHCYLLMMSAHQFIKPEDLEWCLERAVLTEGDESRKWAHIARFMSSLKDCAHVELWITYKRKSAAVAEAMPWPEQVTLGSPEANAMKREYLEHERRRRRVEARQKDESSLQPPASEQVRVALDRCLAEEPELFWWLLEQMSLSDQAGYHSTPLLEPVDKRPGWQAADESQKGRILEAARRYLRDANLPTAEVMQSEVHYVAHLAPALAVHLLLQQDQAFLKALGPARWQAIGPFLLLASVGTGDTPRQSVELAYQHAAEVMRDTTMLIISRAKRGLDVSALTSLEDCLDEVLAGRILSFLRGSNCEPEVFRGLLVWLLRHNNDEARKLAESILQPPGLCVRLRLCQEAAISLVAFASDVGWPIVWPLFEAFPDFGVSVLREVAHHFERRSLNVIQKLSDEQLGALSDWFLRYVPPAKDPRHEGAYCAGPDDAIRDWRDSVINQLKRRASASACNALRELCQDHPECPWLRDVLLESQELLRNACWTPPSPRELLLLLRNPACRIVSSASQLLELIIESLDRYAKELHGTTPTVPNLWDESPDKKWRPKREDHLSDNLAQHLRRDLAERGIVVNREVEIRRRQSQIGQPGEVTDVHVNAVASRGAPELSDVLTVIVEVKGCWHAEVSTAMQTQLVDRYLAENQCKHGLYAVGWFVCDAWDETDYRKQQTPWESIGQTRDLLARQAHAICQGRDSGLDVRSIVLDCTLR